MYRPVSITYVWKKKLKLYEITRCIRGSFENLETVIDLTMELTYNKLVVLYFRKT